MASTKKDLDGGLNLTPARAANLKAVLRNVKSLEVDWRAVMEETGVSSPGNA
jgi:hypothetical protein